MNLTLIISSLNTGGAEKVISLLANYLCSKGHNISLITLDFPTAQPFYPLDPNINLVQLDQSEQAKSLFLRLKNIFRRVFCLRNTIRSLNPDVIISFVDVMNITTLIASIGLNIPTIVSERIDPSFHSLPKFYVWLRFKIYPLCCKLIVQTENSAHYFLPDFLNRIRIIPNLVEQPKKRKQKNLKKIQRIITIGRLDRQKDHVLLIHAFSNLLKRYPDLTLTIYGDGVERNNLENLIEKIKLKNKVLLPGITKNIQDVLMSADLFVFPSRYEGFSNALCEAMAVGLPVIASSCSGNVDIICDGVDGRLFPVGDVDALTEIMVELFEDFGQRVRLSKKAQEVCTRFHPDRIYDLWDQVIAEAGSFPKA